MDNPKVAVRKTKKFGRGVFAVKNIKKSEVIAKFAGSVYEFEFPGWNDELANHVIQFERRKWRDSAGIARLVNHSCDPNCGIRDLFKVVAMRNIKKGEELTWDYEMTEDADRKWWYMKCRCGTPQCRKIIGAYRNMPEDICKKYGSYVSLWLRKEFAKPRKSR